MSTLLLRFDKNLEEGSKQWSDLFNNSLTEQYAAIAARIPQDRREDSFRDFIGVCFPQYENKYYFSFPNFDRQIRKDSKGIQFLNNVVIRPQLNPQMKRILPDGQNVILIGDIVIDQKYGSYFRVKGIELIDDIISPINDTPTIARVQTRFEFQSSRITDPLLTPDFIHSLIDECYTVSKPAKAKAELNKWKAYLEFRHHYLNVQSGNSFQLNGCSLLKTYVISKSEYQYDPERYDAIRLKVNSNDKIDENVFLTAEAGTNSPFSPLVMITVDRNKKKFLESAQMLSNGKSRIEEEAKLKTLTNGNVFLSRSPITADSKQYEEVRRNGKALGERVGFRKEEILPDEHIESIKLDAEKQFQDAKSDINDKYDLKIEQETKKIIEAKEKESLLEIQNGLDDYRRSLEKRLDEDIRDNNDKWVKAAYQSEVAKAKKSIAKPNLDQAKGETKAEFEKRRNSAAKDYENKVDVLIQAIDIRKLYLQRNERLIKEKEDSLRSSLQKDLKEQKRQIIADKRLSYTPNRNREIEEAKAKIDAQTDKEIKEATENETIIRFSVFFALENELSLDGFNAESAKIEQFRYIGYDNRAEMAIIKREENALEGFMKGYVKNPYLSTYLFSPESLPPVSAQYEVKRWYLDSLNDLQKEAVKKALASNGVFLLQGPPGTGKTQVIAETIAHLVKQGKKVLVSSETHKAIDNVFERLPKIPEIIPIRLIPSTSSKNSDYAPEHLLENFYRNIYDRMEKSVQSFEDFEKTRDSFENEMKQLKLIWSNCRQLENEIASLKTTLNDNVEKIDDLSQKQAKLKDSRDGLTADINQLASLRSQIRRNDFGDDSLKNTHLHDYLADLSSIISPQHFNDGLSQVTQTIIGLEDQTIDQSLSELRANQDGILIKAKIARLKKERERCIDEAGDPIEGHEKEARQLQAKIRALLKEENASQAKSISNSLTAIFKPEVLQQPPETIKSLVHECQKAIEEAKAKANRSIDEASAEKQRQIDDIKQQIETIQNDIRTLREANADLRKDSRYADYESKRTKLQGAISTFFVKFNIHQDYQTIEEAFGLIEQAWKDLSGNFERKKAENQERIPIYKEIAAYLKNPEVIKQDEKDFTKPLFDKANVIGITCTTDSRIKQSQNPATQAFNLGDKDIKTLGIDVVIIDEVSKCSFLDLLIPILYGKTIILVGDHRQLPPMYDLGKLQKDDFESLDPDIITYSKNQEYKQMYEDCFFKRLFEKIGNDYKIMLQQQYRCHSQIMDVFNHFYSGQLRIGFEGQNKAKEHNISLTINGFPVITPEKHIYFIDCQSGHESRRANSTSIRNEREAEVIESLIARINDYFLKHPSLTKLSLGVICTYGDQARLIKNKLNRRKYQDFSQSNGEKPIISTVDDFQGDERDIIFLSLVRNPECPNRSNPGFINAYQRINVALSRARRLLIIVGNRKYVETKGVIDLPDINGDKAKDKKNFRIYERIIEDTIRHEGKILLDDDVIVVKEGERR